MKLWEKRKKLDNSGMAMVLVIVAIALVTLLVSVLMSVSLINFQMKVTEEKAKENFYSAEGVLDQIHVGLQQVVSKATEESYMNAMKHNGINDTEAERKIKFNTKYTNTIVNALREQNPNNNINEYLIGDKDADYNNTTGMYEKGLLSFLDKELAALVKDGKITVEVGDNAPTNESLRILPNSAGVVLEDLVIGYTDTEGFYSEIQTDIALNAPDISLKEVSSLPNAFDYSIIAHDSLVMNNGVNQVQFLDSVYVGKGTSNNGYGLILNGTGNVNFGKDSEKVRNLVVDSKIKVEHGSYLTLNCENVFAKGIDLMGSNTSGNGNDNSSLTTDGDLFIADDLTLNDWNLAVDLNGRYFGYCGANGIDAQSAIVLNSGKSKIDLDGLEELVLSGSAYINGAANNQDRYETINPETGATQLVSEFINPIKGDVMLGTSLAVKSDQIAFLVPAECLGSGMNPMTENKADQWRNMIPDDRVKLNANIAVLNKNLGDYGFTDSATAVSTVIKYIGGERITYVYLNFTDPDMANAYYRDYMTAAEDRMKSYMDKYQNDVKLSNTTVQNMKDMNKLRVRGNVVTYSVGEEQMFIENTVAGSDPNKIDAATLGDLQTRYTQTHNAMVSMLSTDYAKYTPEILSKDIYENLIDIAKLQAIGGDEIREYTVGGSKAIVANPDPTDAPIRVGGGTNNPGAANGNCSLVITTGDVIIEGDFEGTIIAGGSVEFTSCTNPVIKANKQTVTALLRAEVANGQSLISYYFKDGDQYDIGVGGNDDPTYVDLGSVIKYENWTKK